MQITCDSANKMVKKFNAELAKVMNQESLTKVYSYLQGEEPYAPEYDFLKTQMCINEIQEDIQTLKHAIHKFNLETMLPGLGITADEALIRLPMLTLTVRKLDGMRQCLPKTRSISLSAKTSEFTVCNYDIQEAELAYQKASAELTAIQQGLDTVNLTIPFEVSLHCGE